MNTDVLKREEYRGYTIELVHDNNMSAMLRFNVSSHYEGITFAATESTLKKMEANSCGRIKGFVKDADEVLDELINRYIGMDACAFNGMLEKILALNSTWKVAVIPFEYNAHDNNTIYDVDVAREIPYMHDTVINMFAVFEVNDYDFRDNLRRSDDNWLEVGMNVVRRGVLVLQAIMRGELYTCRIKDADGNVLSDYEGILKFDGDVDPYAYDLATTDACIEHIAKAKIDILVEGKEGVA